MDAAVKRAAAALYPTYDREHHHRQRSMRGAMAPLLTAAIGEGGRILSAEDVAALRRVLDLTHALLTSSLNVAVPDIERTRADVVRLRAVLAEREETP